ncbi:MAG TPA: hypothetical protein V6C85_29780 [Allocoleopsis sp.]
MANYAQYQMASDNWMLGHFVVPISRSHELEELLPAFPLKQWSLSAILSKDVELDIDRVRSLQDNRQIAIAALEIPPLPPEEIERVFPLLPAGVDVFFEIPLNSDLGPYLSVLQKISASAKIRTGGITAEAFPSVTQLSQCISAFAKARVPFKATAGLHHPLPNEYHLTYEPDSPSGKMHGFLNVTILAALVYGQNVTPEETVTILQESAIERFHFNKDGIEWSDRKLSLAQIEEARQQFFRSFGSCSFQEPIDDLMQLKLLS